MKFVERLEIGDFYLTGLRQEDVGVGYLSWFSDVDVLTFIEYSQKRPNLCDLKDYVDGYCRKNDAYLLGIFRTRDKKHVGNIKYDHICLNTKSAEMGILIGEPAARGIGVAGMAIETMNKWLLTNNAISTIGLGVEEQNTKAIRAYEKLGFSKIYLREKPGGRKIWRMELALS